MRLALTVATILGISISSSHAAGPIDREVISDHLAEAAALAATCRAQRLALNADVFETLWIQGGFELAEKDALNQKIASFAKKLRETDNSIVCRDAVERYGPTGIFAKNLLIKSQ